MGEVECLVCFVFSDMKDVVLLLWSKIDFISKATISRREIDGIFLHRLFIWKHRMISWTEKSIM